MSIVEYSAYFSSDTIHTDCYCRLLLQTDAPTRPTYRDTTANTGWQTSMKQKGIRESPPPGVRHHETTRDERLRVITLRDESGMSWAEIGRRLNIHRRTVQKVVLPLAALTLKAYSIDKLYPDIPQSKRDRHSFESKPFWPSRIVHRCRKARIDCLCHPRSKNPTPLLGRNHCRNGLCMLSKDRSESGAVYGIPQAHTPEKVQCAARQ